MHRRRFNLPISSLTSPNSSSLNVSNSFIKEEITINGFKGFLSPNATHLLLNSYHLHLRSVAELAFGSAATISQAAKDLFRIVEAGEREEGKMKNPRLLHHASQAWNLDFFLRGLSNKETDPPDFVLNILSNEFGSFDNFKRTFQSHASAMIGCGWIWLVKNSNDGTQREQSNLNILTTFNGASPLFKSDNKHKNLTENLNHINNYSYSFNQQQQHISTVKNSPILGLNLWESAFILDYSLDRDQYVRNWWKAINWNVASVLLSK